VEGVDTTTDDAPRLVTRDGQLGRLRRGQFEAVLTREFYYHIMKILWDLQPIVLAHAQATDALTQATLGYDPGYWAEFMALDENGDEVIDDTESGKDGMWDFLCASGGFYYSQIEEGKSSIPQLVFRAGAKVFKYAEKAWNVDTSGGTGQSVETTRIFVDTAKAFHTALTLANGAPGMDAFFNIPYGTGTDGVPKWPSLQYARHVVETDTIHVAYELAKAYAEATGQGFTFFVPDAAPYFPAASYTIEGLPNIVEISNQASLPNGEPNPQYDPDFAAKVFTVWFENGEQW
jgi:hypothetical protein